MTGELRTSIEVDATPEVVWEVLMDVPAFPQWARVLTAAEGSFAEGGRVTFVFPPSTPLLRRTVPARVLEVSPGRRLRFELRLARWGIPGLLDTDHTLTIVDQDAGVRLWLDIRFRGLLFPLLSRHLDRDRAPAFGPMPTALKERIEAVQAGRETGRPPGAVDSGGARLDGWSRADSSSSATPRPPTPPTPPSTRTGP